VSIFWIALTLVTPDPLAPLTDTPVRMAEERLVRRGEPVTLRLRQGALTIATAGRSLGEGGKGERVRVVALATRRTLEGVVEGPGEVRLLNP
jgi:flagella basal body P-ring formation protein FlgA